MLRKGDLMMSIENEDDYHDRLLQGLHEEQDSYNDMIREEQDLILLNLQVGDVEDFEFVEQLYDVQSDLVEALAKDENDKAIGILRRVFDSQILNIAIFRVEGM